MAISKEDFDKIAGDRDEADAAVHMAEAARDLAKLNLEFTHVTSPISGWVSRRLVDEGNLVKADDTVLTTIVTTDPMYVYFDVDERTMLRDSPPDPRGKDQVVAGGGHAGICGTGG